MLEALWELHFQYLEQFLAALLPMALTVAIHGQGMKFASRYFRRFGHPPPGSSHTGPHVLVLIAIAAIMLATTSSRFSPGRFSTSLPAWWRI